MFRMCDGVIRLYTCFIDDGVNFSWSAKSRLKQLTLVDGHMSALDFCELTVNRCNDANSILNYDGW